MRIFIAAVLIAFSTASVYAQGAIGKGGRQVQPEERRGTGGGEEEQEDRREGI